MTQFPELNITRKNVRNAMAYIIRFGRLTRKNAIETLNRMEADLKHYHQMRKLK